jgi:hypothetical protein
MSGFLERFARDFASLNASNMDRLGTLYADEVHFSDPLHEVHGLVELSRYFEQLYANVSQLEFDFTGFDEVREGQGYLRWTMRYRHPRLKRGALISVDGCSLLCWNDAGKVVRHRDFFDAGALLYEHLPLLGCVIGWLRRRLA